MGHGVHRYERHRLLYQFVEQCHPAFVDQMAAQDATLPEYVQREFDDCLKCGRLEYGFLRVRCTDCHQERLVAFSWPLLRIHAPAALVTPFTSQAPGVFSELRGAAYGRKRGVAGQFGDTVGKVGKVAGFSLHAGMATKVYERKKPERLCRYSTGGRAPWSRTRPSAPPARRAPSVCSPRPFPRCATGRNSAARRDSTSISDPEARRCGPGARVHMRVLYTGVHGPTHTNLV
jgi:hypothetical protein